MAGQLILVVEDDAHLTELLRLALPGMGGMDVCRELRRVDGSVSKRLEFPSLTVDIDRREVSVYGEAIALAPKEFDLLAPLPLHPHSLVDRLQVRGDGVEAMGGQVGLYSQAGLGATFWFSLPLAEFNDPTA